MIIDPGNPGFNKSNSATAGGNKLNRPDTAAPAQNTDENAAKSHGDSVSLSSQAQTMAKLEQAVQKSGEIDSGKVEQLKLAIANGDYQANSDAIAERMLGQDSLF